MASQFSQESLSPLTSMYARKRKSTTIKKALKRYRTTGTAARATVLSRSVVSYNPRLNRNYFTSHQAAFPQRFNEVIRDHFRTGYSQAANSFAVPYLIVANGPYDAGTGSQPAGFTNLMGIYSKCFVKAAKLVVNFNSQTHSGSTGLPNNNDLTVGITISTLPALFTSLSAAIEGGLECHKFIGQTPDSATCELKVDIGKYLSVPDVMSNSQLFNTATANPGQLVYMQVWIGQLGASAQYTVINGVMEYDCVFTDPNKVT